MKPQLKTNLDCAEFLLKKLTLKKPKVLFQTGLCLFVIDLWDAKIITFSQKNRLLDFIEFQIPHNLLYSPYKFPCKYLYPRIKWLRNYIKRQLKSKSK